MIEAVSKKLAKFYQFSILVAIVATVGIIFYFWKIGLVDGSRGKDLHQASYILESYEAKKPFEEVKKLIRNENPKLVIKKINASQVELEKVNKQVEMKEFDVLKEEMQTLKKATASLISFSKTDKVINVFNGKLSKFNDFVERKNWRTLTRMSERVFSKTKGHVNKMKLGSLVRDIERDFDSMIKITERSILTRNDKAEVKSRISNLRVEIKMLSDYKDQVNHFYKVFNSFEKSLNAWMAAISPEITLQKMEVEQTGRYYVMGFVGLLLVLTTILLGGFAYNRWFFANAQKEIEAQFEKIVSEGMLERKFELLDNFSDDFKSYAKNMNAYFEKRMSFGSIFQEALPLSAILLDKNLKVIWANNQFCDDWCISEEEIKKDYMSWDFLNKLTNIGNDDPVLEALKYNVAGIYQVKIKANDEAEVRPFEMFVSPTSYQGETRVMLFFYDLTNLEQTIQEQAKGILNPVKSSLELLAKNNFEPTAELENGFKIAKIENVYDQFSSLNQMYLEKELRLNDQIEYLHNRVEALEDLLEDVQENNSQCLGSGRSNVDALKSFKNNVIGLSELSHELDSVTSKGQELIFTNINALKISANKINELKSVGTELIEAMPRYNKLKEEIRTAKSSLYESKSKLSHELSQLTILMKTVHDTASMEKIGRTVSKINATFSSVNEFTDELDKKVSNLELLMSKSQMILGSSNEKLAAINNNYELQQIQICENQTQSIKKMKMSSTTKIGNYETEIVSSLQEIFKGTKESLRHASIINKLVEESKDFYEEPIADVNQANSQPQMDA